MSETLNLNLFLDEPMEEEIVAKPAVEQQKPTANNWFNVEKPTQPQPQARLNSFMNQSTAPVSNKPKKLMRNIDLYNYDKELNIKVFGIGGAGNNMVNHMANYSNINKEWLYAINTDYKVLRNMPEDINAILIGNRITNGHGSGSDPEIGMKAALEDEAIIREALEGTNVLFMVSGMGKGTGTGASPVIAKIAKEMGILVLSIVNLPSITNEGPEIYQKGQMGLKNLTSEIDGILTISNEKLFTETSDSITLKDAFNYADSVISKVIYEIITLINCASVINVDFNDVKTFFKDPTTFQVNTFEFSSMENIEEKILQQLNSQIYQDDIINARQVIVNYKLNPNVSRDFVTKVADALMSISQNNDLNITYAVDYFDNVEFAIATTIIAKEKCADIELMPDSIESYSRPQPTISTKPNIDTQKPIQDIQSAPVVTPTVDTTSKPNPQPIQEIEIINTKTVELESKSQTVQIPSKEQASSPETELRIKQIRDVFSNYSELSNEMDLYEESLHEEKNKMQHQDVHSARKDFIPTKKLDTPSSVRTIRFSHPSANMDRSNK